MYKTYLSRFLRFLLELLNGPLVNFTPLQSDQVTSAGGLARVHLADKHNVDVGLFLSHSGSLESQALKKCYQAV